MKTLLFAAFALAGTFAWSATDGVKQTDGSSSTNSATAKEQEAAAKREKFLTRSGGMIPNKKVAKGSIAVVNAQKLVSADFVKARTERLESQLWFRMNCVECDKSVTIENIGEAIKVGGGTVTVVLADAGALPAIVHLPELRACLLNVAALAKDSPDKAKLEKRVAKELSRSTAFVLGIGYSQNPGGLMSPFTSLAEIDDVLVDMLPSDLAINSDYQAGVFGITRFARSFYRKACEEGWAPPPKNKYQEAIWKEFREIPSKPMKIKYDPVSKKGVVERKK